MDSLVQIKNNQCPFCMANKLRWHYKPRKSSLEVFSCGHFVCKDCYNPYQNICTICNQNNVELQKNIIMKEWICANTKEIYFRERTELCKTKMGALYYDLLDKYCQYKYIKNMEKARKIIKRIQQNKL
jgi:hypothetical protein